MIPAKVYFFIELNLVFNPQLWFGIFQVYARGLTRSPSMNSIQFEEYLTFFPIDANYFIDFSCISIHQEGLDKGKIGVKKSRGWYMT